MKNRLPATSCRWPVRVWLFAMLALAGCPRHQPLMTVAPMALPPESKCLPGDTELIQRGKGICVPELRDLLKDYNHFPACDWPNTMPCAGKI